VSRHTGWDPAIFYPAAEKSKTCRENQQHEAIPSAGQAVAMTFIDNYLSNNPCSLLCTMVIIDFDYL
jgi:hypothetical protein